MNIQQMIDTLEKDFTSIKIIMNDSSGKKFHSRLQFLLIILNITKPKCMELCGYTDMIYYYGHIEITYDSKRDPIMYTEMNYYEETKFCENIYKYIHKNYEAIMQDNLDIMVFKTL